MLCQDAVLRTALVRRFEKEGWDVQEASHRADVERKAVQFLPHIVFLEGESLEEIPDMLMHWKKLPTLARARVIVGVGLLTPEGIRTLLGAGVAAIALRGQQSPGDIVRLAGKELAHIYAKN